MTGTKYKTDQKKRLEATAREDGGREALADFGTARTFGKRDHLRPGKWVVIRHTSRNEEPEMVIEFLGAKDARGTRTWGPLTKRDEYGGYVTAQTAASIVGEGVAIRLTELELAATRLDPIVGPTLDRGLEL